MKMIKTKGFELAANIKGDPSAERLALCLPGKLDTKDYAHMVSHVEHLAGLGYLALSFDPPGSWESSGTLNDYTTTTYLQSVNEVMAQFDRPTLFLGHSRGGAVAMLAAAAHPAQTEAVVALMASYGNPSPADQRSIERGWQPSIRDLPGQESRKIRPKRFKLPITYFTDGAKHDPAGALHKVKQPKLLVSGTNDEFFSPAEIKAVYDTLEDPKEYLEVNSDHDYRYHPEVIEEINQAISKFVAQYLDK